jgi:hypothetical protein
LWRSSRSWKKHSQLLTADPADFADKKIKHYFWKENNTQNGKHQELEQRRTQEGTPDGAQKSSAQSEAHRCARFDEAQSEEDGTRYGQAVNTAAVSDKP